MRLYRELSTRKTDFQLHLTSHLNCDFMCMYLKRCFRCACVLSTSLAKISSPLLSALCTKEEINEADEFSGGC